MCPNAYWRHQKSINKSEYRSSLLPMSVKVRMNTSFIEFIKIWLNCKDLKCILNSISDSRMASMSVTKPSMRSFKLHL